LLITAGSLCLLVSTVSAGGLSGDGDQIWHQNTPGIADEVEMNDRFGYCLAWGDFNDDGHDDLVVGAPFEDINDILEAGAVHLLYGKEDGLSSRGSERWVQVSAIQESAEWQDHFGSAVAVGDFNGDGFDDLAINANNEDLNGISNAGLVHVIYGTYRGLSADDNQIWHQDLPGMQDQAEEGDQFGKSLEAGDFNADGYEDLVLGMMREDINGISNVGMIQVIYGSDSGLSAAGNQVWHQNSPEILDESEADDWFGNSLALGDFNDDGYDDLAVGAYNEDRGGSPNSGMVHVIYGSGSGLSSSGSIGAALGSGADDCWFGYSLAGGDFDGDGKTDLAVGAPECGPSSGGYVVTFYGTAWGFAKTQKQYWHQNKPEVVDSAEDGDAFGGSLETGDFNADGRDDLAIGVFNEDIEGIANAGMVNILYGKTEGLAADGNQGWHQGIPNIQDEAEEGDHFGTSLAAGDFNGDGHADLAVGAYREDLDEVYDAGMVNVLYAKACSFQIVPPYEHFSSQGDTQEVSIEASSEECGWTVTADEPWIDVSPDSGAGDETLSVSVDANDGPSRQATLNCAEETHYIWQLGAFDFDTKQWIIAFYVAYWNRAADPEGLAYWLDEIANGSLDLSGVAENFALSEEARAQYSYLDSPETASREDRREFVSSVYQNLLNREPDQEGLDYWVGELESGASTPGLLIGNVINAAWQANSWDWMIIKNKIRVAEYFALRFQAVDLTWEESHRESAQQALENVTDDAMTVYQSKAIVDMLLPVPG
jgi:hypothetical protein